MKFLPGYPDIKVEITVDHSLIDIVASVTTPACDPASKWRRT